MKTFNPEANMKTQNHFNTGMNQSPRSARSLVLNLCGCRREPAANLGRGASRAAISAAALLLCVVWLALPRPASAQLDYSNDTEVATYVRQMLYWQDAAATNSPFSPSDAAFRYKVLLYTNNGGILANPANIANLYTTVECERAFEAETILLAGLAINPGSPVLRGLLLDIYYDSAVAESIYAENAQVTAEQAHFGGPNIAPPAPTGGFIIDNEIADYTAALESNRLALATYCALLTNSLGMPCDVDGTPMGYSLFQEEVPGRGLDPANCLSNGVPVCVIANTNALYTGYKDLVLLYELLSQQGSEAATLANLYFLRNGAGDVSAAQAVITDAQRSLFLHAELLETAFPNLDFNDPALANSGVGTAVAGVSDSLAQLDHVQIAQSSGLNPLGFDPNFLVFMANQTGGTDYDSYDILAAFLNPNNNPNNALGQAGSALTAAQNSYATYGMDQDQLASASAQASSSYESQLDSIVGLDPTDPSYTNYPMGLPGSQLNLQFLAISNAVLKVLNDTVAISNLYAEMSLQLQESIAESNVDIDYGDSNASVQKTIGYLNAGKDAANAIASSVDNGEQSLGASTVAEAVNAAVQISCDVSIGNANAAAQNLAAQMNATIEGLKNSSQIAQEALTLTSDNVDVDEDEVGLQETEDQLLALQRQKASLENELAACDSSLTSRYFADPVHQLTMQADMVNADLAFQQAQQWLFYMARDLEYEWNTPFTNYNDGSGKTWSSSTLFKLRNAGELEQFYNAMVSYDELSKTTGSQSFQDWFSVREDFFGYKMYDQTGTNLMYYPDPANPGGPANLTAIQAFQQKLMGLTNSVGDIVLNFSTVCQIPGGTFFVGPQFDNNLTCISPGMCLDKITSMHINLVLANTPSAGTLGGNLTYGGTSFIRDFNVGTFLPGRPDLLANEMTAYSTRYWYFDPTIAAWRFTDAMQSAVTMTLTTESDMPPSGGEIDVFNERSVATSGWVLDIPTSYDGTPLLNINQLDDVQLDFDHQAVPRQIPTGSVVSAAATVEGQQAAPQNLPFPYYLIYHPNPVEGGK